MRIACRTSGCFSVPRKRRSFVRKLLKLSRVQGRSIDEASLSSLLSNPNS